MFKVYLITLNYFVCFIASSPMITDCTIEVGKFTQFNKKELILFYKIKLNQYYFLEIISSRSFKNKFSSAKTFFFFVHELGNVSLREHVKY